MHNLTFGTTSSNYIPIYVTHLLNCLFLPFDTDSQINKLRLSDSVSPSFKTRLTSVNCFCSDFLNFKHGTRNRKHDDAIILD